MMIRLKPAKKPSYKYTAIVNGKEVNFGADGYTDFTLSKDEDRKKSYLKRHQPRENWTKGGIKTPGFWSRWLLWNKPTLKESIKDIEDRFNVNIIY